MLRCFYYNLKLFMSMVFAYLRVSTGKQHLENQMREIEKFASRKGLVIDVWIKEVVSGKKNEKFRALGKLKRKVRKGDIIIITEISRLSRTLHEVMSILGYFLDTGVLLYSTKDGFEFDDSISSQVMAFAFGLAAQIEHKLISQRTREALAVRKAAGMQLGRKREIIINRDLCWSIKNRYGRCFNRESLFLIYADILIYVGILFMLSKKWWFIIV